MAAGRKVLVELVHVECVHGADDVRAELGDVHVAEVDVLTAGGRHGAVAAICRPVAVVFVCHVDFSFRGGGRCWRSVRVTWTPQRKKYHNKYFYLMHTNGLCCINVRSGTCKAAGSQRFPV